jgi:hypothetical protein
MVLSAKAAEVGVRRALFGDLNVEKDDRMSEKSTEPANTKLCFAAPWGVVSVGFKVFQNNNNFQLK